MMRKFEEIREFLTIQFSREKKRLKSFGTKASSFDLAHAVARHIQALMTESRHRELKRFMKKGLHHKKEGWSPVIKYLNDRLHATKVMRDAISNVAKDNEANRPWKPKPTIKQNKDKKKHKHGHSRGSGSSRH